MLAESVVATALKLAPVAVKGEPVAPVTATFHVPPDAPLNTTSVASDVVVSAEPPETSFTGSETVMVPPASRVKAMTVPSATAVYPVTPFNSFARPVATSLKEVPAEVKV